MASIKGKLFEYFVFRLLVACGFRTVNPDGLLVYEGSPGLMVQGMGQPHNADVLLAPPIQTPFYYPTRLIVECKCYNDSIGLPQIRNALGLRDDVNNLEIVTEEILENRKNNFSTNPKFYDAKRYVYQVAVASIDGFKSTAFPFAMAHRIPLISFAHSAIFASIRQAILELDEYAKRNKALAKSIGSYIDDLMHHSHSRNNSDSFNCDEWCEYIWEIEKIERNITIGLLEDGTLLFLLQAEKWHANLYDDGVRDDGYTILWSSEFKSTWVLNNRGTVYYFELPKEIYENWKRSVGQQRKDALRIKRNYFSKIVLFRRNEREEKNISIIRLSERFMYEAERSLNNQNNT